MTELQYNSIPGWLSDILFELRLGRHQYKRESDLRIHRIGKLLDPNLARSIPSAWIRVSPAVSILNSRRMPP